MPKKLKKAKNAKNAKSFKIAEIWDFQDCQDCRNCRHCQTSGDWNSEISRNVQDLRFFRKNRWVFWKKKLDFYSKSLNVANLLWNAYQTVLFLKNVFRPNYEVYWQISQNFERWKNRKLWRRKSVFSKEKTFSSFKSLLYETGKPQNMPVVAGGLVDILWSKS